MRHTRTFGAACTALATLLMTGTALAQVETITVTAQKREQSIQDVPIAVSAYSGEFLAEVGVEDVFDLQFYTPGLVVTQSQTSTNTSFVVRGVGTSSQNFGLESSVGLYVDGVYRARQGSFINDLTDVERIEILRGPQGTLFGRNTPAGAISVVTAQPEFEFGGFGEVQVGNFDLFNVKGAVTGPIVEDKVAARISGFYTSRDGVNDNVTTGNAINDRNRYGGRLQFLFTPTSDLEVKLIADYSKIDEICCAAGSVLNGPVDQVIGLLGGTVLDGNDFFDREVTANFDPVNETEDYGISAEVNWDIAGHTLTSITGYRIFDSFDNIDADFTDLDLLRSTANTVEEDAFSQEIRLASSGDGKLQYVVGAFYYNRQVDSSSRLLVGDDTNAYLNITTGGLVPIGGIEVAPGVVLPVDWYPAGEGTFDRITQDQESWAIFGQADYSLTERLILTAGLRYTSETKEIDAQFFETIPLGPNPLVDPAGAFVPGAGFYLFPPLTPQPRTQETLEDEQLTGTAKISFYLDDDTLTYASYGRGFKSGGTNTDRIPPLAPLLFDAETSDSYEIGLKTDQFNGMLRINAAAYYTTYDDFQTNTFVGTGFFLQNAGEIETFGGELEIFATPTEWLDLTAAIAYTDATYASFETGPCQIASPDPSPNGDGSCDRTGDRVPSVPKWTAIVGATATHPLEPLIGMPLTGFLRGELNYKSSIMTDTNNDPLKEQEATTFVNLRAGIRSDDEIYEAAFWVRNLTEEDAAIVIFDPPIQDGSLDGYPTEPRTYGFTLRGRF